MRNQILDIETWLLPDIRQKKEIDHTILSIDNGILWIFLLFSLYVEQFMNKVRSYPT